MLSVHKTAKNKAGLGGIHILQLPRRRQNGFVKPKGNDPILPKANKAKTSLMKTTDTSVLVKPNDKGPTPSKPR